MADEPVVTPNGPAPEAPAVEPLDQTTPASAPAEAQAGKIPPEVAQIPAMSALLQGQPAATSVNLKTAAQNPELKLLAQNEKALRSAGFGTYRALSGDIGVIFNALFIHPEELISADKAGQLAQIAPPFDALNTAAAQAGPDAHPALIEKERPRAPKSAPQLSPPAYPAGGQPAESAKKLNAARMKNLEPQMPSQGSKAGNLLREITKPVL